ncbi:MAG TPA: nitroreductase family protein [Chloroflexota bacterium]|nr:nitroreductase family protein [Chloroflexota bacterium]
MTLISTSPLLELVLGRRSTRRFATTPIGRDEVRELLEQASWAPSPHNAQPWRFTALFEFEDRSRLARAMASQLAGELAKEGTDSGVIEQQTRRSIARIESAPVAILCSLHADGLVRYGDGWRNDLEWAMAVQSVGAVLQTLFLLAAERGIGTCWMAAPMYCPQVVRETLSLPPGIEPQALVLMGYPDGPGKIRDRRTGVIELR